MFSLWYRQNTLCWQTKDHTDIFINQRIEYYLNNTINLRPLTPHIMTCYTHKNGDRIVAIDSVTSLHPMYLVGPIYCRLAHCQIRWRPGVHKSSYFGASDRLARFSRIQDDELCSYRSFDLLVACKFAFDIGGLRQLGGRAHRKEDFCVRVNECWIKRKDWLQVQNWTDKDNKQHGQFWNEIIYSSIFTINGTVRCN